MSSSSREKPRYLLIADLLGGLVRLSSGRLMLSALGLEEEQEAAAFDKEEEEPDVADPRPWPGPVELVVLRSPTGAAADRVLRARRIALANGLLAGLEEGCTAAMHVQVQALVGFRHLWQALANGIALARSNASAAATATTPATPATGGGYRAAPVHMVVTDTKDWFFLTIQAVGAATPAGGTGSHAGDAAAGLGTAGSGGDVAGVDFATSNGETFRMSNCSFVQTSELRGASPNAECLVQLMYRLFTGLYPDMDISSLPAAVREAEERTRQAADGWLREMMDSLEQQQSQTAALRRRVQ